MDSPKWHSEKNRSGNIISGNGQLPWLRHFVIPGSRSFTAVWHRSRLPTIHYTVVECGESPSFPHGEPFHRRRSRVEASTLLDPTFSLVTRAMSTQLAVSKSRPIRDARRPLQARKVAEAPLSPRSAKYRRTKGEGVRGSRRRGEEMGSGLGGHG